jgi:hypothetical protein
MRSRPDGRISELGVALLAGCYLFSTDELRPKLGGGGRANASGSRGRHRRAEGHPGVSGVDRNLVGPSSPNPVTTVSTVDPIKVTFAVGEQEYLRLSKQYKPTDPTPPLELILADGTVYPHLGKYAFAGRQVNQSTGAIEATGLFPNPGNILRPGRYGKVRVAVETLHGALLVPQQAVSELQGSYQVSQPIFTAGRLRSNVRLAKAQRDSAVVQYQKAIQTVFTEVSNALIAHQRVREGREKQGSLVAVLEERKRLAYMRYQGGVDTQLNALDADRDLLQAKLDLRQIKLNELLNVVQLYKALGGGWQG